jgi:tripartite-type tricarboxylate transporter receptor subunit TctC
LARRAFAASIGVTNLARCRVTETNAMNRFLLPTRWIAATCTGAALLAAPGLALAQTAAAFPSKPVRVLVPLSAGGGVDTIARKLAEKLATALKQPMIVDNKPGAAGILAIDAMAKSPADGHTIALVAGSMIAINPHVLKKIPYDTAKDLAPVAQVGTTPLVLLVNANHPAKTLKEFLAAAKAKPKEATFGSYGNATVGHLLGEELNKVAGVDMVHVPYKGAAPAIYDLIGGQITAAVADFGSARSYIGPGGKLRALALSAPKRVPAYPNVPTFGEEGLPQLDSMNGWLGVFVPAKTPKDVVDKLAAEIGRAVATSELKAGLADLGYEATGVPTDRFAAIVKQDTDRWGAVIKSIGGITLD